MKEKIITTQDWIPIEKINENQIRCTLTKADLEDRQIRLSELAYGTEKAKSLFRDMMQQANIEFGFEADNIPLMIEAIPISKCPDKLSHSVIYILFQNLSLNNKFHHSNCHNLHNMPVKFLFLVTHLRTMQ